MWSFSDFLIAFLPAAAWLSYVRREDVREPEPRLLVLFALVLGCGAANVIAIVRPRIEHLVPSMPGIPGEILDAFVVTALPEEVVKLAAVCLACLWSREWNEPMDGIVYGVAAPLPVIVASPEALVTVSVGTILPTRSAGIATELGTYRSCACRFLPVALMVTVCVSECEVMLKGRRSRSDGQLSLPFHSTHAACLANAGDRCVQHGLQVDKQHTPQVIE